MDSCRIALAHLGRCLYHTTDPWVYSSHPEDGEMVALDCLRLLTTKNAENRQHYHTCSSIYSAHFAHVGIVLLQYCGFGCLWLDDLVYQFERGVAARRLVLLDLGALCLKFHSSLLPLLPLL